MPVLPSSPDFSSLYGDHHAWLLTWLRRRQIEQAWLDEIASRPEVQAPSAEREATDSDQETWRRWLESSPEHRVAWSIVERVSARFAPIRGKENARPAVSALRTARRRQSKRRRIVLGAVLGGGTTLPAESSIRRQ